MGSTAKERAWALQKGASPEHVNREGDEPRKTVINGPEVTRCAFRLVRSNSFLDPSFGFRVCCGVPR